VEREKHDQQSIVRQGEGHHDFHFDRAEGQIATIATKLELTFDAGQGAANLVGMAMKFGESSGEGELLFDMANGRTQRSTTRMTVAISVLEAGPVARPRTWRACRSQ
jgi:hypothetical protein